MRALVLVAAAVVAIGALSAPADAGSRARSEADDYESDIFSWTNVQRDKNDLRQFRRQDCVQEYADRQAKRMAAREEMFHQNLRTILRDCNLRSVGENVAYGFDTGKSVVVDGWMESEGHRANILHGPFRLLGTGAKLGDDGFWYAVQVFGQR